MATSETATGLVNHPGLAGAELYERRERVFLVLAGFFLCAMTMLNIVGITHFVQLGPLSVAAGVLPYPLTFLCTDLICELYGRRRANFMVTVGLILNGFILLTMWLIDIAPAVPAERMPPWQAIELAESLGTPSGDVLSGSVELFQLIYACTSGAVVASMAAYIAAQYCDVQVFHFLKRLTKGKYLWVRNNFSTLTSQLVDSIAVISVTFGAAYIAGDLTFKALMILMFSNYAFKAASALLDTIPFYILTAKLRRYLDLPAAESEYRDAPDSDVAGA